MAIPCRRSYEVRQRSREGVCERVAVELVKLVKLVPVGRVYPGLLHGRASTESRRAEQANERQGLVRVATTATDT